MGVGWKAARGLPRKTLQEGRRGADPAGGGIRDSSREMECGKKSGGRARQGSRAPGPAGLPGETAPTIPRGSENGRGFWASGSLAVGDGSDRERSGNHPEGPGSPEEEVRLGRPLVADAQALWMPRRSAPSGLEPARPLTRSPRRLSELPDAVLWALPAHGAPRPWVLGARAQPGQGGCAHANLSPCHAEASRVEWVSPPQLPPQPPRRRWPRRAPAPDFSFILSCSLPRPSSDWLHRV